METNKLKAFAALNERNIYFYNEAKNPIVFKLQPLMPSLTPPHMCFRLLASDNKNACSLSSIKKVHFLIIMIDDRELLRFSLLNSD